MSDVENPGTVNILAMPDTQRTRSRAGALVACGTVLGVLMLLVAWNPWNLAWLGTAGEGLIIGVWLEVGLIVAAAHEAWRRPGATFAVAFPLVIAGCVLTLGWLLSGYVAPRPGPAVVQAQSPSGFGKP